MTRYAIGSLFNPVREEEQLYCYTLREQDYYQAALRVANASGWQSRVRLRPFGKPRLFHLQSCIWAAGIFNVVLGIV